MKIFKALFILPLLLLTFLSYSIKIIPIESERKVVKKEKQQIQKIYRLKYLTIDDLKSFKRNNVNIFFSNNYLILEGDTENVNSTLNILNKIDIPKKQVLIRVNTIEFSQNAMEKLGINFSKDSNSSIYQFLNAGIISILEFLNFKNISMNIDLMKRNGDIKIQSSSDITVVDGKDASIFITEDLQIISNKENIKDMAGIILKITPRIIIDGEIKKIETNINYETSKFNNSSNVSKIKNTVNTTIQIINKRYIHLAGINENTVENEQNSIPILSNIPLISRLFENNKKTVRNKEIIIEIYGEILENE